MAMLSLRQALRFGFAVMLLGACATMPPEQAALNELAWEVAKECEGRFAAVKIGRPDQNGRVAIGSKISGEGNRARQCFRETMRARRRAAGASTPGTADVVEETPAESP